MSRQIIDVVASVRARILNLSKKLNRNFDSMLLLYMQERFLYRLSISQFDDNFILKGGLLLFSIEKFQGRPTKDMDFLARKIGSNEQELIKAFKEIVLTHNNDGLVFDAENIDTEEIIKDGDYKGIRIMIPCSLGVVKKTVQVDVGFGDVIVPKPIKIDFPVLLPECEVPYINAYSMESVIAEKFQAMARHGFQNSRLKDFYDIRMLSQKSNYDGRVLQEAISETFENRETPLNEGLVIFADKFVKDGNKEVQWEAFMRRIGISELTFVEVMKDIIDFVKPIWDCICKGNEFFGQWDCEKKAWERLK